MSLKPEIEMTGSFWVDDPSVPSTSSSLPRLPPIVPSHPTSNHSGSNVFRLLAQREISPRTKHSSKRLWGESSECNADSFGPKCEAVIDAKHALVSWVEAESLRHLSAKYCPLLPPPRSTIAAAFSPDGRTLASTHGDHTVKIIDCQTGSCLKVLSGHRRTPWVVRFHPLHPEILASGSLDHEVRLWDKNTAECIGSRDFYRPIASIAFHAQGELLAVASGHKLYIWHYDRRGDTSSPTVVLKTRRSLRAVHFHPHAAPFLLTAEVNDLDSPDSLMTLATSPGYLHYPPPAVFLANVHSGDHPSLAAELPLISFPFLLWPSFARDDGGTSLQHANRSVGSISAQQRVEPSAPGQLQTESNIGVQCDYLVSPMDMSPVLPSSSYPVPEDTVTNYLSSDVENAVSDSAMETMETAEVHPVGGNQQRSSSILDTSDVNNSVPPLILQSSGAPSPTPNPQYRLGVEFGQLHQLFPFGGPTCWELPFLQGWLMGQRQAGLHAMHPFNGGIHENSTGFRGMGSDILTSEMLTPNMEAPVASAVMPTNSQSRLTGRSGLRHRSSRSHLMAMAGFGEGSAFTNITHDESEPPPVVSRIQSELVTSLAAAAAAELPCTVKLRIWPHDIKDPCAPLDAERCCLSIPHAVLCSEMGAHFSPCGRFLAACVACMLPRMEADPGLQTQVHHDVTGTATSPTRHPISAHQVMYELRIYSLEKATFGSVLASRAIRAAHCLTSIQFSPTSEHILLAYGRRHSSLLKSIVIDGETTVPIYTILEVYRVSDMELVRVLPSAEDEVNVACFHPSVGGGLVYGTKEGKLRILQYDGFHGMNFSRPNVFLEGNMLEIQTYASEG